MRRRGRFLLELAHIRGITAQSEPLRPSRNAHRLFASAPVVYSGPRVHPIEAPTRTTLREVKLGVVHDVEEAGFGTDERGSEKAGANAATHVDREKVRTGVASGDERAVTRGLVTIAAGALPSNAAPQVKSGFLAQRG